VSNTVPGPPASVLASVLAASPSHPYDPATQARRATFSGSNFPDLPSLTTDVVALPQYAYLDANVEVAGTLTSNGWATGAVVTITAAYTPGPAIAVVLADASGGAFTVTLPDATQAGFVPGQRYTVKKTDASSNVVTLAASAGQLIDGASTQAISPAQSAISVVFTGAAWEVTSGGSAIGTNAIGGVTVSGTPSTGEVLTATGPAAADWQAVTASSIGPVAVTGTPVLGQVVMATSPTAAQWATQPVDWLNVVTEFGAKADIRDLTACAITSGTNTLTCSTGNFTAADVGKVAYVYGAGTAGAPLITTVAGFTSSTTITLTANAATTVASGNAFVGTDDTAAWQNALTAVPANGGVVYLPAGHSYISATLSASVSGTIIAGGGWGSQIRYSGSTATPCINATTASSRVFIRDIRISQVDPTAAGTAVDESNFASSATERVLIDGGGGSGVPPLTGVDMNGASCHYNAVRDCRISYSGASGMGVAVRGTSHSNTLDNCRLVPGASAGSASSGIYITNAHSTTLIHPDVEQSAGNGIFLDTAAHATTIINPYLESNNINLQISSGVIAPTVTGGTIESGVTANIQDNGSIGLNIQNAWPNSSTNTYNHVVWPNTDLFTVNGVQVPHNNRQPGDLSLIAWNYDPILGVNSTIAVNGTIYLLGIVLRYAQTITNLAAYLSVAATTATASENFLALVDSGGVIRGSTAAGAIDTATQSAGWLSHAMSAAYAAPAGRYWVACLFNAATPPTFARATGSNLGGVEAGNATAASFWVAVNGTGATALPGSFTMSSNTHTGAITACVGVS